MGGWTDVWMDGRMNGWMDPLYIDALVDRWVGGVDGWVDC